MEPRSHDRIMIITDIRKKYLEYYRRLPLWKTVFVLVFITICYQIISEYYYKTVFTDQSYQYAATKAFMAGEGLTIPYADPADLAKVEHRELISWPFGYSVLLVPFLTIMSNAWLAMLCLDGASFILAFFAWHAIIRQLKDYFPRQTILFFWLYWALAFTPFMLPLGSTGNLAFAFFSAGMAFLPAGLLREREKSGIPLFLCGVFTGFACLMRYGYWPLAAVAPAVCILMDGKHWLKALRNAIYCAIGPALAIGLVTVSNKIRTSHATYLTQYFTDQNQLLHLKNLLSFDPFPSRSLGLEEGLTRGLRMFDPNPNAVTLLLWLASFILLVVFFYMTLPSVIKKILEFFTGAKASQADRPESLFCAAALGTTTLVLSMLCYLSIRYPAFWSPVGIKRYYAMTFPFFLILAIQFAFGGADIKRRSSLRVLHYTTRILLVISFLCVGFWRAERLAWHIKTRKFPPAACRGERGEIISAVREVVESGEKPVFIADQTWEPQLSAAAHGGAVLLPVDPLTTPMLATSAPVNVIVALPINTGEEARYYQKIRALCQKNMGKSIFADSNCELLRFHLDPETID